MRAITREMRSANRAVAKGWMKSTNRDEESREAVTDKEHLTGDEEHQLER
jgi:hypothetical protein